MNLQHVEEAILGGLDSRDQSQCKNDDSVTLGPAILANIPCDVRNSTLRLQKKLDVCIYRSENKVKTYVLTLSAAILLCACGDSVLNIEAKGLDRKPNWESSEQFRESILKARREVLPEQRDLVMTHYVAGAQAAEALVQHGNVDRLEFYREHSIREALLRDFKAEREYCKEKVTVIDALNADSLNIVDIQLVRTGMSPPKCVAKIQFTNNSAEILTAVDVIGESRVNGLESVLVYQSGVGSGYSGRGINPGESVVFDNHCYVKFAPGEDLSGNDLTTTDSINLRSVTFKGTRGRDSILFSRGQELREECVNYDGLIDLTMK